MNLDTYFSFFVWWDKLDIDVDAIFNFCHRLKQSDPRGNSLSNAGGWQSKEFYYGDHPELTPLLNEILRRSKKCLSDFGYDEVNFETYMDNVWVNINKLSNYIKLNQNKRFNEIDASLTTKSEDIYNEYLYFSSNATENKKRSVQFRIVDEPV